jgi:hypothetical protein
MPGQRNFSSLQAQEQSQAAGASTPAGLNTACTASYSDLFAAVMLLLRSVLKIPGAFSSIKNCQHYRMVAMHPLQVCAILHAANVTA